MKHRSTINRSRQRAVVMAVGTACMLIALGAEAGGTINFGEDKSISLGMGMRASFTSAENAAPSGTSRSSDFSVDSLRLYINAAMSKQIKATFNTERDGDNGLKMLDGYAQFEFTDGFNVWVGRMLPASDRANLDGPYFLNAWSYPGLVSQYPAKFAGRDNGVNFWGKLAEKRLTYVVGMFEGHNNFAGASSENDNLLYAGRVQYDFWDTALDPAYYTSSTYYGSKDVLSVGIAAMYQKDGVGSAAAKGNYQAWNIDALMEKKIGNGGALTLEGAYYSYDTGDVADVASGFGGSTGQDNVGGISQGKAVLAGAAYLLPQSTGPGKFQPYVRFQSFDNDLTSKKSDQSDVGVNYILAGHSARFSATYTVNGADGVADTNKFTVGMQMQF